jgi:NADH:ubiquinone oxidoreductase subunit E
VRVIAAMKKILVCTNFRANPNNPSCAARGSKEILEELTRELAQRNVSIKAEASPCMGFCNNGPNLRLTPSGPFFHDIATKDIGEIIKKTKAFLREKN